MKVNDAFACQYTMWYEKFKKITVKSIILPLPPDVLVYLNDKGTLVLPEEAKFPSSYETTPSNSNNRDDDNWDVPSSTVNAPKLNSFDAQIRKAIDELGGAVFPKLNWSSPKDAAWISLNKSLKCSHPRDLYLLLKSSSFITHDLAFPFQYCEDAAEFEGNLKYCLVLKQWREINPSDEFRCFVKDGELIGIMQREVSQYYTCIASDAESIVADLTEFWENNIENIFPLPSYVFDVVRSSRNRIILLDFGPFGLPTDSLLFDWNELHEGLISKHLDDININASSLASTENFRDSNKALEMGRAKRDPEFRFISDETGVQPGPYAQYGLPLDVIELSTGQNPLKLIDFLQMKVQQPGDDSSTDDESST